MAKGIATENFDKLEVASEDELRAWLSVNHAQEQSIWLVTLKSTVPLKYLSREAALGELTAHGWIDGVRRKLDDNRTMQLISPRSALPCVG